MRRWLRRHVLARPWLALVVMAFSFLAFGVGTLNLIFQLQANLALLAEHGWLAVMEGGLLQLVLLLLNGILAMLAWLMFKACEVSLVQWLAHKEIPEDEQDRDPAG